MLKQLVKYQIVDIGPRHPDYFGGFGCSYTEYTQAVTGSGTNAVEAYQDALEQIFQGFKVIGRNFPKRPIGIKKKNHVPAKSDKVYYVGIRYTLKDA